MLVAVSGSQSSGKSTLLHQLNEQGFKSVSRKTSRSIMEEWGVTLDMINSDYDLTIKFQDEILKRKLQDELDAVNSDQLWFTERTFADLFTYALITLGKENSFSDYIDQYYIDCMQAQQSYKHIFYLKAGMFNAVHDGIRGSNQHYSRMVDQIMWDITNQLSIPGRITMIDTPCIKQRVNIIKIQSQAL